MTSSGVSRRESARHGLRKTGSPHERPALYHRRVTHQIAVTGFGPFVDVERNASGEVALALAEVELPGVTVHSTVLPVTFDDAPRHFDTWFDGIAPRPAAIVALGVQKEGYFRLERRARTILDSPKRDNSGRLADGIRLEGEELETAVDLGRMGRALEAAGARDVRVSDDAGGFVCERVYHHALSRAAQHGIAALFLHVPPVEFLESREQTPIVAALLRALSQTL